MGGMVPMLYSVGVVLALGCLCVTHADNDCDEDRMQQAQLECFSQLDMEFSGAVDAKQIQSVLQNNPGAVCRNPEQYKSAIQCSMDLAKTCLRSVGTSTDILPDADRMMQGITYLCQHIQDVDVSCVQQQQQALQMCAYRKALETFSSSTNTDVRFITCKAFELTSECLQETLKSCPGKTMEVFVKYTENYLFPPACESQTDDSDSDDNIEYKFTTLAPITTASLVAVVPVLPKVTCYDQDSIQKGQRECFSRENIAIQLPQVQVSSGTQAKQSYLDAILANNKDISMLCQAHEIVRYQRAIGCAMDVARQCMPEKYRNYLPDANSMKLMLGELCKHADEVDQGCITEQASALFDCGFRKAQEMKTNDLEGLLCNAFRYNVVCQKEVLPVCGCMTTATYVKISKLYLNPPACPAITEATPMCDPDSLSFVSGGASGLQFSAHSLAVFLLAYALAAILAK